MKIDSKRFHTRLLFLLGIILFLPNTSFADAGVPMLAIFLPGLIVLFLPIFFLEASVARRQLGLEWRESLRFSFLTNLASTFLGVPLTWCSLLAIEVLIGYNLRSIEPVGMWKLLLYLLWSPWLPPLPASSGWGVWAAAALLCLPFFFATVWLETRVGMAILGKERRTEIQHWSYAANTLSYAPVAFTLATLAVVEAFTSK